MMKPSKLSLALTVAGALLASTITTSLAAPGSRQSNLPDAAGQPRERLDLPTVTLDIPPEPESDLTTTFEPNNSDPSQPYVESGSKSIKGSGSFSSSNGGGGGSFSSSSGNSSGAAPKSKPSRDPTQLCGLPASC